MSNNTTALLIGIIFLFGLFAGGGAVILFSDSDSPIDNSEDDLNSGETIDDNSSSEETLNQVEDNNSTNSTDSNETQSDIIDNGDNSTENSNSDNGTNVSTDASDEPIPLAEQCLDGHSNLAMHIHPWLKLTVRGSDIPIPSSMGIDTSVCPNAMHVLHTHDDTGKLHIETYEPITVNLSLFFAVWNISQLGDTSFDPLFLDMDNVTITIDGVEQTVGMEDVIFEDEISIDIVFDDTLPDSDGDGVDDGSDVCEGYDDNTDWDNDGTPDGCDADDDGPRAS